METNLIEGCENANHAFIDKFSENLGLIYDASLISDKWPYALQALCEDFGASKALLLYMHPEELTFSFASGYGFDPYSHDIGVGKFRRYLMLDPVALYALEHVNEVFADRRVIDPVELRRSPMQTDIRDPVDMEYLLTVYATEENIDGTILILFRGREQETFNTQDELLLNRYLPHIKRATRIHKVLAGSQQLESLQTAILNHLGWGVILVDDQKNILNINDSGKAIIESCKTLFVRNNRLYCLKKEEQELLNQSISGALERAQNLAESRRLAVKIGNTDSGNPIFIVTTPVVIQKFEEKKENLPIMAAHYTTKLPNRRYALITFCDPNHYKNWNEMLRELFDLSPAEAALVGKLADNCSLKEAAQSLGRTVGTARIQLQSIFDKTGTNRQSSLVRLLMSIPS